MSLTAAEKENLRDQIADRLIEMESMFDPRCKLAFVMRAPHLPDGDIIVTNDDPKLVIKAIERLAGYEVIAHPDAKLAAGTEQTAPAEPPLKEGDISKPCNCTVHVHCPRCKGADGIYPTAADALACLDCSHKWRADGRSSAPAPQETTTTSGS